MPDKARVGATNSRGSARLTQVLAGESGRDDVDVANPLEFANVPDQGNVSEPRGEDSRCTFIDLAEQFRTMPGLPQPELDAADAGEQACDSQRLG